MPLPRCEKHNVPTFKGQTECYRCAQERETPEEREEWVRRFHVMALEILPFAVKLKARMLELKKKSVRVACPSDKHEKTKHIWARIAGPRNHLHFACEDESCHYRIME